MTPRGRTSGAGIHCDTRGPPVASASMAADCLLETGRSALAPETSLIGILAQTTMARRSNSRGITLRAAYDRI